MTHKILYAACLTLAPLGALATAAPPAHAAQFTTLYNFASNPNGGGNLVTTPVVLDNVLYGAADIGGTGGAGDGTIFKFDLDTNKETTLVNFTGTSGPKKGQAPTGPLSIVGPLIFGSAVAGGLPDQAFGEGLGVIWELNHRNGKEHVFHTFNDKAGGFPLSGVTPVNGVLYGATDIGGPGENGTLFKLDPAGKLKLLYNFPDPTIGCNPQVGVVLVGDVLYGTTSACGVGAGTVFSYDLTTGEASVLHSFEPNNQLTARANALLVQNGALYGTTFQDGGVDGESGPGTVFKIDLATNQYTVVHQFGNAGDGTNPSSGLTLFKGTLYGVTEHGGLSGSGTVFSINPATGEEAVVHSFTGGPGGDSPAAGLFAYDGALYGTTTDANSDDRGTLYKLVP